MKLTVAGKDRSGDLGKELEQAMATRPDPGLSSLLSGEASILALKDASDETEYLTQHLNLIQSRHSVDPSTLSIPHNRGITGRCLYWIRRVLWKLLFPFQNQITFCQNTVNQLLTNQIRIEHQAHMKKFRELEQRVQELEKQIKPDDAAHEEAKPL